jgi:magnesium-transporting ATPase (P-type)
MFATISTYRRAHVLFTLFVFFCFAHSGFPTHTVLCFVLVVFILCLANPMLPVFMDCTFLFAPSVFSKVCQWLATGRLFSPGSPVSSTNKTDRHDIAEILLKVALDTIKQTISKRLLFTNMSVLKSNYNTSNLKYLQLKWITRVDGCHYSHL